jgi:exodeoxyribonuclease V alpha subunit
MEYIKGKVRQLIYESDSGYKVGVFRVKETNDEEMQDFLDKTITFVGYFANLNKDDTYTLNGKLVYNDKYGYQYKVDNYEKDEITGVDATIAFLTSPLIKGVGEKTAQAIVKVLGEDTLSKIKENYQNLLLVPGITEKKAVSIYNSIIKYQSTDDIIVKLKKLGFTINEALNIVNKYGEHSLDIINTNAYALKDIVDFNKIDTIYQSLDNFNADIRNKACFVETIVKLEMETGNTYFNEEEVFDGLKRYFNIILSGEEFNNDAKSLNDSEDIVIKDAKIFLYSTYEAEDYIAEVLLNINSLPISPLKSFASELKKLQEKLEVTYNDEQVKAIENALHNRITIITGGPGTGKTTIVKAITTLYIKLHKLSDYQIREEIALIAPTGRASKKLADATGLGASTIHRYLKWNKENNEFGINEYNPNYHKLIIVDETSMIDTNLFAALLKGLTNNIQLVLVGDANQLPSVGPGLILSDLINSKIFTFIPLYQIYRQSPNSYIPVLAQEIKDNALDETFLNQKDDYNFLTVSTNNIKESIKKICELSIKKGLTEKDLQVLIPMYKGEIGIDNINVILQNLFNPKSSNKKEITIGGITYRVGDKVLQLVNNPEKSVFNGDIGYITNIVKVNGHKDEVIMIDFDGINAEYKREEMLEVKHAYCITIHKAQGSEFPHVIMPISKNYYKMLYNKLIYTGVSRAKKSLVLIGEPAALQMAINNNYATIRQTDLLNKLRYKTNN